MHVFTFYHKNGPNLAQILPQDHTHWFFLLVSNEICLGIQLILITLIGIQQFWKMIAKAPKNTIFWPNLCKNGVPMGHAQNQKTTFLQKQQNQIISFTKLLILSKYHTFWLSYECFSIFCDVFFLKSVISSHISCGLFLTSVSPIL